MNLGLVRVAEATTLWFAQNAQPIDIINFLQQGGMLGLLVAVILLGSKRMWVFGWQYRQLWDEKEEWRKQAQGNLRLSDKSADVSAEVVSSALSRQEEQADILAKAIKILEARDTGRRSG